MIAFLKPTTGFHICTQTHYTHNNQPDLEERVKIYTSPETVSQCQHSIFLQQLGVVLGRVFPQELPYRAAHWAPPPTHISSWFVFLCFFLFFYFWNMFESFMQQESFDVVGNDHTSMTAPLPVCSAKLSMLGLSQYYGGGPRWNPECCSLFFFLFLFWMFKKYIAPSARFQNISPSLFVTIICPVVR